MRESLPYINPYNQKEMEKALNIDKYCAGKLDEWLLEKGGEDGR